MTLRKKYLGNSKDYLLTGQLTIKFMQKILALLPSILVIILSFLLVRQCNQTEIAEANTNRIQNNYEAAQDSLKQFKIDSTTTRAEIRGYELKLSELSSDYKELLGKFNIEKNKPPRTLIDIQYVKVDSLVKVPVYISSLDSMNSGKLSFFDSTRYDAYNYRYFNGAIPFSIDTTTKPNTIKPSTGSFIFSQGMNLKVDTDHPNITFTSLKGASILDDSENSSIITQFRKRFSLGLSLGYGLMYNSNTNTFINGPYFGIGVNYQPKWSQW
jgi:uncharacterized protein YxeA